MDTRAFSTKSERKTRINPSIPGIHLLGLDMGYSGIKCFYENGNFVFPNFVKKLVGPIFGDLNKYDMIHENIETGVKHFVGEKAVKGLDQDTPGSNAQFDRNHYLSDDFVITFETALGMAFWDVQTNGNDIFIQTGLPPAYLTRDEMYIRKAMEGNHQFALTIGSERKTFNITLKSDQIDVMSQPMGTYYSVVINDEGKITPNIKEYSGSRFMVFDGGFGTLDKFLIENNSLVDSETDANLGMRRVFDETRELIQKELGVDVSIMAMQNVLKTGKVRATDYITLDVVDYEIDTYLDKANELVREEAFKSIRNQVPKLRYLIMTGGTGAAWYDYFKQRLQIPGLEVMLGNANSNLPAIYANARGYYMYRLNLLRQQRK